MLGTLGMENRLFTWKMVHKRHISEVRIKLGLRAVYMVANIDINIEMEIQFGERVGLGDLQCFTRFL